MTSLSDELGPKVTCPLTGKKYIGNLESLLEEKITLPAVEELLTEAIGSQWIPSWDCNAENKIQQAKKVIAICILTRLEETIESLLAEDLTDRDLPLSQNGRDIQSASRIKVFRSFTTWKRRDVAAFLKKQWRVLKPTMELDHDAGTVTNIQLNKHCALKPAFASCDELAKTDFSTVFKGAISAHSGKPMYVAIKKFARVSDFDREKNILDTIRSKNIQNDHLMKHLAICDLVPCIIFPWADGGDLAQFWKRDFLKRPDDFLWSLEQMVGLAHALELLHQINCRHGDLKPANILYFTQNGTGILKIADFGIARTHTQKTGFVRGKTITSVSTRAYEAPEATSELARSRRYDCWSMGCIMLEFFVWLLYDFTAIANFTGSLDPNEYQYYRLKSSHDRQISEEWEKWEVHPKVIEAMDGLRADERCRRTPLAAIVDIVEENLLKIHYEDRIHAVELHKQLQTILDRVKTDSSYRVNLDASPKKIPSIFSQSSSHPSPKSTYARSTYERASL